MEGGRERNGGRERGRDGGRDGEERREGEREGWREGGRGTEGGRKGEEAATHLSLCTDLSKNTTGFGWSASSEGIGLN